MASFLALQLGLAVAIEWWLPQYRDPMYGYRAARFEYRVKEDCRRKPKILIVGSSHVMDGVDTAWLEDYVSSQLGRPAVIFNLGVPGAGPVADLLHLRRLFARNVRPDIVFVEATPFLLGPNPDVPPESPCLVVDRLWLGDFAALAKYRYPVAEMRREWWQAWPVPWFSHRFPLLSRFAPGWVPPAVRHDWARHIDDSGWHPKDPDLKISPDVVRQRGERERHEFAQYLNHFQLNDLSCQALRDFLALCHQEGIVTGLIWMPADAEFRSWYSPQGRQQARELFASLRRDFGTPLVDAEEWVPDEHFLDHHHMLYGGARIFTERFGREVLLPSLRYAPSPESLPIAKHVND
jgi:hypothetical protein